MSKIIYIAGLGHSGTTILDMALGASEGVIGLGELNTILDDKTREKHFRSMCSCGKQAENCDFWQDIPTILKEPDSTTAKYEAVLSHLTRKFGGDTCLVDSSKNDYPYLKFLNERHDLKMILLTRDVRSWSYARALSTGKPVLYYVFRWFAENLKIRSGLKKMNISFLTIGYEELALYPELIFKKIIDYAGLKSSPSIFSPAETKSHIISGNVARTDKEKRSRWTYDARWMTSRRIMLWSPFILLIRKFNQKQVYSNIMPEKVKDFYLFGTIRKQDFDKKYN